MTVDLRQLFLLGLATASAHWLLARSEIAKPLWSRARGRLDQLLRCAGCSGWWLGLAAWPAGIHVIAARWPIALLVNGLAGVMLTPIFEGALLWGLRESAVRSDEPEAYAAEEPNPVLTSTNEVTPVERPR